MKIVKYDKIKEGQIKASSVVGGGGSSSTTIGGNSFSLDRMIWGKEDKGEDVDGTMTVNGDINIKVIEPLSDEGDDEQDDGSGEYEDYEEGGGNLNVDLKTTTNELEVNEDAYIHRHLYINYPSHPEHSDSNKKCVGEVFKSVEDDIKKNADGIKANSDEIKKNADNIKTNADEIEELKKRTTANETAIENYLPIGSIIMFNGQSTEIPDGWHICDGTEGTPNLTDKFIKASNVCGTIGGSNSITLTSDNLPYHTHSATALSTFSNSNISNSYNDKLIPALDEFYENPFDLGGSSHYVIETGYNNKSDKGLVSIKVSDLKTGTVSTEVTVDGTGSDSASIDIQPSYYSLIFICKIN